MSNVRGSYQVQRFREMICCTCERQRVVRVRKNVVATSVSEWTSAYNDRPPLAGARSYHPFGRQALQQFPFSPQQHFDTVYPKHRTENPWPMPERLTPLRK